MTNLTQASQQLYRRPPDERFQSLPDLHRHCVELKNRSRRFKEPGTEFEPIVNDGHLALKVNGHGAFQLNEWSLSQLCSLAAVSKDTVNRSTRRRCTSRVLTNFDRVSHSSLTRPFLRRCDDQKNDSIHRRPVGPLSVLGD